MTQLIRLPVTEIIIKQHYSPILFEHPRFSYSKKGTLSLIMKPIKFKS